MSKLRVEADRRRSRSLGDYLDQVPIGVAQQGVAVVVAGVMRRLERGNSGSHQVPVGRVNVVGPDDQHHGRASRRGVHAVDALGRFDRAEPDREPAQPQLDMFGGSIARRPECLSEPKEVAVKVKPSLNVAGVEIDERVGEHANQGIENGLRTKVGQVTTTESVDIGMLPGAVAGDAKLTAELTDLINGVYAVAEKGLWVDGASRTTVERVKELVRAGQIAVARAAGQIVGCLRIQFLDGGVGEFGMLAVIPCSRGTGVGRDLVRFAEQEAHRKRCDTMQLEVLVPRGWSHPSKEFLTDWYTRSGYKLVRIGAIEESYPELAPLLATPCDYMIYRKAL